jgi:uncharacterized protein (DUF433 family)
MIDWSKCPEVERSPDVVSGTWVFRGTRVPVAALFENLEDEVSLAQFVEWFPGVSLAQARAVLALAGSRCDACPLRPLPVSSFLVDYSKIITLEADKRGGKPCIRGLRITVSDVLDYLASGMTHAEILADFPDLTEEDLRACLAFAKPS